MLRQQYLQVFVEFLHLVQQFAAQFESHFLIAVAAVIVVAVVAVVAVAAVVVAAAVAAAVEQLRSLS